MHTVEHEAWEGLMKLLGAPPDEGLVVLGIGRSGNLRLTHLTVGGITHVASNCAEAVKLALSQEKGDFIPDSPGYEVFLKSSRF